jgi:hypothetical protein
MGNNASTSDGSRSSESQGSKSDFNVHVNLPSSSEGGGNPNVHIDEKIKKDLVSSTANKK